MKRKGKTNIFSRIIKKITSWCYEEDPREIHERVERSFHRLMAEYHKEEIERLRAIIYTRETGIPVPSGRLDMSIPLPPKKHRQKNDQEPKSSSVES